MSAQKLVTKDCCKHGGVVPGICILSLQSVLTPLPLVLQRAYKMKTRQESRNKCPAVGGKDKNKKENRENDCWQQQGHYYYCGLVIQSSHRNSWKGTNSAPDLDSLVSWIYNTSLVYDLLLQTSQCTHAYGVPLHCL